MKNLKALTLLSTVASAVAGAAVNPRSGEDSFTFYPITSGTVNLTVVIEAQSPNGDWHQIAAPVTYTTVGAQPAITVIGIAVSAIRARVSAWTSGTISVTAIAGIQT